MELIVFLLLPIVFMFIGGLFEKRGDEGLAGAGFLIGVIVALILTLGVDIRPINKYESTKLYSLNGRSLDVSGSFVLGSGVIGTSPYYIGEVEKDGGYVQFNVPAGGTIKIEKDIDYAEYREQLCSKESVLHKLTGLGLYKEYVCSRG